MKISIIQCELFFGEVDKNYALIETEIKKAALNDPDVIVLPEMWNTSFFPANIVRLADPHGERSKKKLSELAQKLQVNIVGGSVARSEAGGLYNTAYIFDRQGNEIASYNKVHLFSPAGEDRSFEAGDELCVFELDGVACGLIICYDLRFVEWVRKIALTGIKVLFVPAAWPQSRMTHWTVLARARAIENQIFVVSANSLGAYLSGKFGGHSAIIDPLGEYVVEPDSRVGIKTGEINMAMIADVKKNGDVFADRKANLYF